MEYSREQYLTRLIDRKNNGLIKIITGARRAGKSYLLNEIYYRHLLNSGCTSSQIIRFAFDSDEDIDLLDEYFPEEPTKIPQKKDLYLVNAKKFRAFLKDNTNDAEPYYLLLDEVQLLENFVGTLNSLLRHRNYDVYVTGSNSKFLSSDIVTEFKGRGTEVHVLPLVFSEYMEAFPGTPQQAWREYIETGGIPLVAQMKTEEERVIYLKNLCEETYLKDIIAHNGIRKTQELSDTLDVVASLTGTLVSPTKISNTFQSALNKNITDDTVNNFIGYFQDAFLLSIAKRYNIKGRKQIGSPYKIYFEDIGVRNARLNFRQIEETHIMENIIYNELRYRGFNVEVGVVDYSEKTGRTDVNGHSIYTRKTLEVDFVATLGSRKYYVQSALALMDQDKTLQEKRSLQNIDDSYKKIIVTKNGLKSSRDENGIVTMDLFDFLLDSNSLER